MKRSATLGLVSAHALVFACFSSPASAADTGMVYVRSEPPGATVTIDGKECGKAPVLVRDLEPGERIVVVKLEGVAPNSGKVTIEAGKVVKYDVELKLPPATLTVISDPLEATVVVDGVNRGVTPLTLENLPAGEHRVSVDRAGYGRQDVSLKLAGGENRVLELKLTKEGTGPATAGDAVAGTSDDAFLNEVAEAMQKFEKLIAAGDYEGARRHATTTAADPAKASVAAHMHAAADVAKVLIDRQRKIGDVLERQVGNEISLETKAGKRSGKVFEVSNEGAVLAAEIKESGRVMGSTKFTVRLCELTDSQGDLLAGEWALDAGGTIARALLAVAGRDFARASAGIDGAGAHILAPYLRSRLKNAEARSGKPAQEPAAAVVPQLADQGLVGWWRLDDGAGVIARDWSGHNLHGTLDGATWVRDKERGVCLDLGGRSEYVRIPHSPQLNVFPATFSAWVKTSSSAGTAGILGKYTCASRRGYQLVLSGGNLKAFYFRNPRDCVYRDGPGEVWIADGRWHSVVFVVDESGGRVYVDGSLKDSAAWAGQPGPTSAANDLGVGRFEGQKASLGGYLAGNIDDVRVYDRALSAEEVQALATSPPRVGQARPD